ncbi:unnamed protein product [Lymnaea stagnalis]|uniref:G-protein coupled receptors family 1 profile domain-containing protein n=1 Tax=Lymnaea stagnalis TaxID=6523 RepID=A0AAV2HQN2_LYMST
MDGFKDCPRRCKCLLAAIIDPATAATVDTFVWEYVFVLNRAMFCISISMVGVISLERLLVVYFPFSASKLLTPCRMKTVSVLMYSINFMFFAPVFFCFTHTWVFDERLNATVAVVVYTEFYQNNMQTILFESFIGHNLIFLGTFVVIVFISSPGIAYKIWAMAKTRQKMTRKPARFDPQLAKMLLVISSACFIFYSPSLIFDTIAYFIPAFVLESQVYNLFQIFTDLLFAISSSANFIIYVTMSTKFSKAYRSLLVCSRRKGNKGN